VAEAKYLVAALEQGDGDARRILEEVAEDLAFGLSHAVHLFHPANDYSGRRPRRHWEPLRAAVAAALPRFTMAAFAPGPRVVLTALGEDAVPVGALEMARSGMME